MCGPGWTFETRRHHWSQKTTEPTETGPNGRLPYVPNATLCEHVQWKHNVLNNRRTKALIICCFDENQYWLHNQYNNSLLLCFYSFRETINPFVCTHNLKLHGPFVTNTTLTYFIFSTVTRFQNVGEGFP